MRYSTRTIMNILISEIENEIEYIKNEKPKENEDVASCETRKKHLIEECRAIRSRLFSVFE